MRIVPLCITLCTFSLPCACASLPRFKDQPIVWRVDDTADTPPVADRPFLVYAYAADIFVLRRLTRAMELRSRTPAANTNALDEVPDSTWFTNRIGRRSMTVAEAMHGPDTGGPPRLPLLVVHAKRGGTNPGFVVKDTTGRKFVIKFDPVGSLELQTGASVIVNRFFWAIGYNVPSDHILHFTRADLKVERHATSGSGEGAFSERMLDAILARVPHLSDGAYRASSSEYLPGVPRGGFAAEGLRDDDPNDVVPHEHRRELRGLRVFAAWLDHTDMKEDNGLDIYVKDRGRHYLRHFLIDFGETLGGHAAEKGRPEDGFEHAWDWENQAKAALAFGLWTRPWEDRTPSHWASVGSIETTHFDPRSWREAYPYWPFFEADAADEYWAAKIVMRFDRPLVEALVATGQISDPAAAAYVANAILVRRDKIGQAYLEGVTAFDELRVEGGRLCGVDLGTRFGVAHGGVVERLDDRNRVRDVATIAPDGSACMSAQLGDYVVFRLRIRRGPEPSDVRPTMQVHVKDGARVVGVLRIE